MKKNKYFIAAHYNLNNGDRAVLEATVQVLNRLRPQSEIIVSAAVPEKLIDRRFKTVSWPKKRGKIYSLLLKMSQKFGYLSFVQKYYKSFVNKDYLTELRDSDIVFISGGHHLTDILGDDSLASLALNYLIPIFEGKKVVLLPQSIGPVSQDNALLDTVRFILENSFYIAYRDNSSKEFLNKLNINTKKSYIPDIVYSLEPDSTKKKTNRNKTIAIAPYCSYSKDKEKKLEVIKNALINTISKYINDNWSIRFISMEENDKAFSNSIIDYFQNDGYDDIFLESVDDSTILNTIDLFQNNDVILAFKTHSVVFSLISYVPLLAVAYHPKSIEFMEAVGLGEYAVYDYESNENLFIEKINAIIGNEHYIIEKEKQGVNNNRKMIEDFLENF